ncbi:MAG: amino terminal protease family [Clostridia bacterium]|jgi:hypothetical protein|nr:amino terminal protease family [Clostridia bacterium]
MNTKGRVTVRGANWLFLTTLILQFVIAFAISIPIGLLYFLISQNEPQENDLMNYLLIFTQIFAVFLPALLYLKFKEVDIPKVIRLKPLSLLHIILAFIIGLSGQFIAQMLNLPVLYLLSLLGEIPPPPIPIPHTFSELIISLLVVALAPAVSEEVMVRGIIMRAYEIRGTRAGLIISALLFGFMHGDIKNLLGPIFFGVIFGYLVIRTGSLFAGMIAHFTNNAFAMLLAYLEENFPEQFPFLQSDLFILGAFVLSIILFVLAIIVLNKTTFLEVKPSISNMKQDLRAAFINMPIMITMVIYMILQIFTIVEILQGNPQLSIKIW